MPEEQKDIESMTDEEFDKFSEEPSAFGDGDAPKESEEEPDEKSKEEPKEEDPKEEPENPEEKVEETEDDSEEEEFEVEDKKPKQRNYNVPLKKLTKQKQKYEEMLAEKEKVIEELKTKTVKPEQNLEANDAVKKFAEEKGLDIDVVEGLVNLAKGDEKKLDSDTQKLIDDLKTKQIVLEEEAQFNKYYDDNVVGIVVDLAPDASSKQLLEAKQLIKKLAYSDKYIKYEIEDVVRLNKDEISKVFENTKGKKSVETNRAGDSNHDKVIDYNKLTGDDILAMSDEEFDKYSEEMGKNSKSDLKITEKGVEV